MNLAHAAAELPVVILCGGRGTRLGQGRSVPKPLVEIGGLPIVEHVVSLYVAQGAREFLLATGYMADSVHAWASSRQWPEGVSVKCVDTGLDTETGGRVHALAEHLAGRPFYLTYADGVADFDLAALEAHHVAEGRTATITIVKPELQFGIVHLDGGSAIAGFEEKPKSSHWVNGGFMRFEPDVFDLLEPQCVLESDVLHALAASGRLSGYQHEKFWACMDTYKDTLRLSELWESGKAPWAPAIDAVGGTA